MIEVISAFQNCKNKKNFGDICNNFCKYKEHGLCKFCKNELVDALSSLENVNIASRKTKALVSGSYDPFTFGHLCIVREASQMFDEVHVVIFKNAAKKRNYDAIDMVKAIEDTLRDEGITNCIVSVQNGLLAEYAANNDITYTVRGLRNNMDYNYEENIAVVNKDLNPNLKTVYLRGEDIGISSSTVRELLSYGKDVSKYVPQNILELIQKY